MRTILVACVLLAACTSSGTEGSDVDAGVSGPDAKAMGDAHPAPDAATATSCAMKDPVVQLIYTCDFKWSQCTGVMPSDHEVSCTIQAAGSLRFSLCECKLNGVSQMQFTSTTICGLASWPALEMEANTRCMWNLH
jgi:hypothetical protein